jgi:FixJ family two-component response regulator/signal transduction histidine kinase
MPAKRDKTRGLHRRADAALALIDRLAFERLLADLAARFSNAAPGEVAGAIDAAMRQLVQFFDYDRCSYGEFGDDGKLSVVASAGAAGVTPHELGPFGEKRRWFLDELLAGRPVVLPALPKGLPAHATAELEHVRRAGLRSHLSIPLRVRGRTTGVLSFAGFRKAREWPNDLIVRLSIIAELVASAAARARSEDEAQRLRSRLWHADRVARVSALTAAIAHEINQPLAAILSNAQAGLANLGRGEAPPEEIRAILEAVVRDDKRAAQTIRTMRAFLRQEENGRERVDLAAALEDVLRLLSAELARRDIRIEKDLAAGCWVSADKIQIEQVVLNLLLNAAQAMEACPARERVLRLRAAPAGSGRLVVEVRDAGSGIKADDIASVFEPFWTTRNEGLGLGLAICRAIIESHGGSIGVESNPDRGVTFRFELAADRTDIDRVPAAQPTPERATLPPTGAGAGPVVCVVDDDPAVREGMTRLIAAQGWAAAAFASAREFLERQPPAAVGCVLLDYQMPGMSGLELQQKLVAYGAAPPIVFLTGHADLAAGVHAMKLGATDFLAKPADAELVVAAVRKALERCERERAATLERDALTARLSSLSAREREVMSHVLRGRLNKQIAADLNIALQTVKQHRGRVMEKMQVRSVAELVHVCEATGLRAAA